MKEVLESIKAERKQKMTEGENRFCDRCGAELTEKNNKCGYEICDKCNDELDKACRKESE